MRIWIDLTNSPHVNFFEGMVRRLEAEGHELLLTARPLANTVQLLELKGLRHHVVGRHYGLSSARKMAGFGVRCLQLYRFVRRQRVDVAISHSSFYSPVVSRMLGIPCVYLNDNEHAAAGNRISFRFATVVMVPEFLDRAKVRAQGAADTKIVVYPGVKEGIYLWEERAEPGELPFDPGDRQVVYVRPEPWTAQYYRGGEKVLDDVLLQLRDEVQIVLLPRGQDQREHYSGPRFRGVVVPPRPIGLHDIARSCDLFVGAGGTMTREAAVLGIPAISTYQDELLDVDRYLIDRGYMVHRPRLAAADIREFLQHGRRGARSDLLDKGREAARLVETILLREARC